MKLITSLFSLLVCCTLSAQEPADSLLQETDTSYWQLNSIFGANGTQTSFVNWSGGGRNNISMLAFIDFSAKYQKENFKWSNDVKLALGGLRFLDSTGVKQGLQKTDDRIDLSSSFGYEFKKTFFYTIVGGFKTQMLDGFNFPNDSVRISTFMAPAYLNFALGIEYAPSESFNLFVSPLAAKITFVNDEVLANEGAFGVEKAVYDDLGNVIKKGERRRDEFGSYLRLRFNKEIMKNIEMKSRLELFSNYINNPQNIDVNAEVIFLFHINKWFTSTLQGNVIYDDDIMIRDSQGKTGPRTQFKSLLGIGISYTLKNFE
ncbi:MAG: hypothetical protein K0R65_679 [Crocinitomicaceae bacterium]|jgi:hypothetical protein|nr:hypothetical protein [Crocinitomicaceae bacterium]